MTDQVVYTLIYAGTIVGLVIILLSLVTLKPNAELGDFSAGFGCAAFIILLLLWTVALVIWLAIHVRIA